MFLEDFLINLIYIILSSLSVSQSVSLFAFYAFVHRLSDKLETWHAGRF